MDKDKLLTDFQWVINSPPILKFGFYSTPVFEEYRKFFDIKKSFESSEAKNNTLSELISFLNSKNIQLLGKYFEALFEFGLKISPTIELLLANQQVPPSGGDTIGEIDFLFRRVSDSAIFHLEVAGKYYLAHKNTSEWENFIGPKPDDNLAKKMNHLSTHQLKLASHPAAKKILYETGVKEPVNSMAILKGYIFYHLELYKSIKFIAPKDAYPEHNKGWWLRVSELEKLLNAGTLFHILDRNEWMQTLPKSRIEVFDTCSFEEYITRYFAENEYPLLVSVMMQTGKKYIEKSKGFIVSDNWPHGEH